MTQIITDEQNYYQLLIPTALSILRFWYRGLLPASYFCSVMVYQKFQNFSELSGTFYDPLRVGHRTSLILVILAELFCSMFLALGLFTRIVAFIIVFELSVAVFIYHHGQPLKNVELGAIYLTSVFTILILGPGRVSVDGMMGK